MTFSEWKKKNSPSQGQTETSGESFASWKANKVVNQNYIKSFVDEANEYYKSSSADYDKLTWDNAGTTLKDREKSYQNLSSKANVIGTWLESNKGKIDDESYKSLSDTLASFKKDGRSVVDQFKSYYDLTKDFYSAEEFDAYVKDYEQNKDTYKAEYDAMLSFDTKLGKEHVDIKQNAVDAQERIDTLRILQKSVSPDFWGTMNTENQTRYDEYEREIRDLMPIVNQALSMYGVSSIDELKEMLFSERDYLNAATKAQKKAELESVADAESENYDPDFERYSVYYGGGNEVIQYVNANEAKREHLLAQYPHLKKVVETLGLDYLNNKEKALFNYYFQNDQKWGADKVQEYTDLLAETLNTRRGRDLYYTSLKDHKHLQDLFIASASIGGFFNDLNNLFVNEALPTSSSEVALGLIREERADKGLPWYNVSSGEWSPILINGSTTEQLAQDALSTTTRMLPSILAAVATELALPTAGEGAAVFSALMTPKKVGQAVGSLTMGASAAGAGKQEMLRLGYSVEQATTYGLMVGAAETLMERFLGGISPLGGDGVFSGIFGKLSSAALGKIDNALARVAITVGGHLAGNSLDEALEEGLQTIIEPWLKEIATGGVDFEDPSVDEVLYSSLLGAISSLVFGGAEIGGSVIANAYNRGQAIKAHGGEIINNNGVDPLKQLASEMVDASPDKGISRAIKRVEKKASAKNVGKLSATMEKAIRTKNKSAVESALVSKGLTAKEARIAAKYILDEEITEGQRNVLETSERYQKAINAALSETDVVKDAIVEEIKLAGARAGDKVKKTSAEDLNANTESDIINTESEGKPNAETEGTDGIHLRDGGERNRGTNSEGSISAMEGGTRSHPRRREGRRIADSEAARLVNEGREVSVASLGVSKGSKIHTVRLVETDNETSSMKKARAEAESRGLNVKFFVGGNLVVEEDVDENVGKADEDKIYFEANGYILGKQVLVRADHPKFTSDQIIRHEIGHDKIAKGEIDVDSVRARLVEIVGEENVDLLAENYALAYAASNYDEAQIWEECICDSLGDMNIFASDAEAAETMARAMPEIKQAIKETSKGANQTRGSPQVEGKASIDIGTNNTDGGITNVRGEETVPDAGNVESGRRVGEKDASGKGSNREHIERKIQEILRKQTVERRDNGFDGRGTARIEKKEAAEAFEDRVQSEGYMYAVFRKTAIAYKLAPKSAWNENAKVAAEHLESFGISVVVFDGNMLSNKSGITQELSSGVTVGLGDLLTVFISSELDIDGMETAYHEAFHALRRMNQGATRHYKIIDIISDGVNVESEAFEKFVSYIGELYSYEVADVPLNKYAAEILEEFYAWYIGSIYASQNLHGEALIEYIKRFSDIEAIKPQLEAVFAEINKNVTRTKGALMYGERGLTDGKASKEFSSPEEAKESGHISDARFSIEFSGDIANKQRAYLENGGARISSVELEKAIADTARMVDRMKPYANILPQDKVGKTLVKNGSYDVSVENTTVCIRTLAYNSFVDMVSEKVGRPLTQMESFLVSQKLYEIAKEPQCLYCYVSLDRKAFNEMVIRYTEQRDEAIAAYEAAGKPNIPSAMDKEWSLFKEFLNGRKPTTNMWDRYVGWLKAYNNGEKLVSLSDISTEAKRLELVESGGEVASQVRDILKYAQSASWAKKQTQYVAYYDEILKLKPTVIKNLNSHYGMRWYSFSDYSGAFIVENMQQITDAAIRGLKGLSYTKDTDFAEIFAPTGMNINISVYAHKTENGYEIDPKQSADIKKAIDLRKKHPNVGIVVVATDAKGVEWALAQEWNDVVIPFHTVRTGADVAEFYNWEIFNAEQNDTVADQNLWDEYVKSVSKKKASKMVYPSEHQNDLDTYLEICKQRGLTPRFKSFLDNPNYMKLVNETRQSESETAPLKAIFDVEAAERSFDKFVEKGGYYEGWYNDGIDVYGEAEIVASDVRAGKKANEVDYGRQDVDFDALRKSRKENRQHGKASRDFSTEEMSDEDYRNFGWVRDNDVISAGYWKTFTTNFADAVKKDYKFNKTPAGEFMIEAYNYYDPMSAADVIVFAKGTIESPEITKIIRIKKNDGVDLDAKRSIIYEAERREIPPTTGDIFEFYYRTDYTGEFGISRNGKTGNRDNNQLRVKRSRGSGKAERVVRVRFDEDNQTISTTYANGDVVTEPWGKASRELDVIDYMDELAEREGREIVEPRVMSDREILANALESIAQDDAERKKLEEYKANIDKMNAESEKLAKLKADIKELTFGKDKTKRDPQKLKELRAEATKTENRINIYDKRLLNLETASVLKDVLQREKRKAFKAAGERARAAMHRAVEGRNKTVLRHKIQRVARELEARLERGTKEKNVKKEISPLVRSALDLSDLLFTTDEELIVNGIGTIVTGAEQEAIDKYLELYEEYHSYDDAVTDNKELRKDLRHEMNEVKKNFAGAIERERIRISEANASDTFDTIIKEYESLAKAENSYISAVFEEDKLDHIKALKEKVGDTLVKDMTLEQLKAVYKAFRIVQYSVSESNKLFGAEQSISREELGTQLYNEIVSHGEKGKMVSLLGKDYAEFDYNNLKPIWLGERLGSPTLQRLINAVFDGESEWATLAEDAKEYKAEQKKRFNFKKWDFKKTWSFKTPTGQTYELNLEQMLTIYAYAQRGEQAMNHLMKDGFVFDKMVVKKGVVQYELNDKTAYALDEKTLFDIIGNPFTGKDGILTGEQKSYVDAMQRYLSDELGKKGNVVSNALYGIDLFDVEYYLPIRSDQAYLERAREKAKGTAKITSRGFTKPTTDKASNAIVLSEFDTLWNDHSVSMSEYIALSIPITNFSRVYNWQNKTSNGSAKVGVISAINNAYGSSAQVAIDRLLEDINGGARSDYREGPVKAATTAFKKAKVALSLSVVVQQPSAILRAQAMISPKYFAPIKLSKEKHKAQWDELKTYAPVAIIKEMGYFDIGMGKTTAKWIDGESTVMEHIDEWTSKGAAFADEVTWLRIWDAVKRETLHNNPKLSPKSKEFLTIAGRRFEDVIRHTQVYDSTLSRSANMRSKSAMMQMVTSFLAEGTTAINMREMALRSKDKGRIARTTAAVYASALLNAFLVALPYAFRDDDEDETFAEKYMDALTSNFVSNINPVTSLPIIKDIWSLTLGYKVERADMSLISDLIASVNNTLYESTRETPDEEKLIHYAHEIIASIANLGGLPIENAIREVKSILNFGKMITDAEYWDTTWDDVYKAIIEGAKSELPFNRAWGKTKK